jgi:hypothetical protein
MDDVVTILKQDEEFRFGPAGELLEQIRVQFTVGKSGPFLLRFPKAGFTGYAARQAIDAFARELRAVHG